MLKIEFTIAGTGDAQRALRIAGFIAADYESEPADMVSGTPMQQAADADYNAHLAAVAADPAPTPRRVPRTTRAKADAADPAALYVAAGGVLPVAENVAVAATTEPKPAETTEQLIAAVEQKVETPAPAAAVPAPAATPAPATPSPAPAADPLAAAVAAPTTTAAPTQALLDAAKVACASRGALWVREVAGRIGVKSIAECSVAQLEELIAASKVTA